MQQCADLIRALAFTSDSSKMLSFTQEPSCPGLSCRELDWLQEQSPEKKCSQNPKADATDCDCDHGASVSTGYSLRSRISVLNLASSSSSAAKASKRPAAEQIGRSLSGNACAFRFEIVQKIRLKACSQEGCSRSQSRRRYFSP